MPQSAENTVAWAAAYIDAGIAIIKLKPRSKEPADSGWPEREYTADEFTPEANIGAKLGEPSGGLIDVDLDDLTAVAMAGVFLPKTGMIFGRASKSSSHRLYRAPGDLRREKYADPLDNALLLELRGNGHQTMLPPSVHPSGETVTWTTCDDLAVESVEALRAAAGRLATAAFLVRHWPDWKSRHHDLTLALAGGMLRGGWTADHVEQFVRVVCIYAHDHEPDTRIRAVRDTAIKVEAGDKVSGWPSLSDIIEWKAVKTLQRWLGVAPERGERKLTDLGNAERLAAQHGDDLRFCVDLKRWYVWDGKRWKEDISGDVYRRAMHTVRSIPEETKDLEDKDERAAILKWAINSENERRITAMVKLAEKLDTFTIHVDEFDRSPWQLNTPSGTVNLLTGGIDPHDRYDLITKITAAPYVPRANSSGWDHFLVAATEGIDVADGEREPPPEERARAAELRGFLQRFAGYAATGLATEEKGVLLNGPEAAGKSTFIAAVLAALGDYAKTTDFDTFLKRQHPGGIRTDLVRLSGARLVASVEVDDGRELAAGLFKRLTGGDEQTARGLYTSEIVLRPTQTYVLVANHAPRVDASDGAMWRRILRVPFPFTVPAEKRDPRLKGLLTDPRIGGEAVLAWIIEGCLAWQNGGLKVPKSVEEATTELRDEMDPLGDFFDDRCDFDPSATVPVEHLHRSYLDWARQNSIRFPLTRKKFGEQLERRGCQRAKSTGGVRVWRGIRLKEPLFYDMRGGQQANPFTSRAAASE